MLSAENASRTHENQPKSKCKWACNAKKKFGSRTTAAEVLKDIDLRGKTILITGTTSGIGVETAKALALAGAHVVMANRNVSASEKLREQICGEASLAKGFTPKIDIIQVDLSSLKSVRNAANEFISKEWPLHVLILNAGLTSFHKEVSDDGHERTFAVNHLAQFYFTQLLMQKLQESAPSRLVIVSSALHTKTGIRASDSLDSKLQKLAPPPNSRISAISLYNNSKLCNMLVAKKTHKLVHDKGVSVYVLHPGLIRTELVRDHNNLYAVFSFFMRLFMKNVEQGAATTVYCAAHPDAANESGKYYVDCAEAENQTDKALVNDELLQDALWERTNELIKNFEANNK
ncbi:short chain dehydrogenase domain-containing protein [Ditylenchus destructor]|uniref:Short chain dehydrogenase domain-containing protein n=1 Tax=Ditylenchus destructor TaxID=166010 RepID=A0AAD4R252_9BILA|nr:short chain dehydrogenase domain-containing protein [Ditylenchus destructor]